MKRGHVPIRTCKGCRKKAPKNELRRFVVNQGILVSGEQGQGYGLYCCFDVGCQEKISKKLTKQKIVKACKGQGRE